MIIPDIFNRPLPIRYDLNYISELKRHLDSYLRFAEELIDDLIAEKHLSSTDRYNYLPLIEDCTTRVIEIISEYTFRDRIKANQLFKQFVDTNESLLRGPTFYGVAISGNPFYRFRPQNIAPASRDDYSIFHIPFDLLRFAKDGRYNVQGLPCLYCADKLSIAWKEVKRPGVPLLGAGTFNAALFKNFKDINYLDFSMRDIEMYYTNLIGGANKAIDSALLLEYLILYPMIISLHTKVEYPDGDPNFHNEWAMPNILMTFFLSEDGRKFFLNTVKDINSIRYSSVEDEFYFTGYNYAFPTRYVDGERYCKVLCDILLQAHHYAYIFEDQIHPPMVTITDIELDEIATRLNAAIF